MFMSILEGQLRDFRFIQFAQAFGDHSVVLLLRRAREREIKAETARESERDAAVLGSLGDSSHLAFRQQRRHI